MVPVTNFSWPWLDKVETEVLHTSSISGLSPLAAQVGRPDPLRDYLLGGTVNVL